jgi:hypothetical protein
MVRKLQIDRNVNIKQNQKQQQEHRKSMLETLRVSRASCWVGNFLVAKIGNKDIQGITYDVKGCQ